MAEEGEPAEYFLIIFISFGSLLWIFLFMIGVKFS